MHGDAPNCPGQSACPIERHACTFAKAARLKKLIPTVESLTTQDLSSLKMANGQSDHEARPEVMVNPSLTTRQCGQISIDAIIPPTRFSSKLLTFDSTHVAALLPSARKDEL